MAGGQQTADCVWGGLSEGLTVYSGCKQPWVSAGVQISVKCLPHSTCGERPKADWVLKQLLACRPRPRPPDVLLCRPSAWIAD